MFYCSLHRVNTEWRLPISDAHPIMMEKSALAGEGKGCTPNPFQPITITCKVAVYAPAERADTLPLFHLYPMCTLWFTVSLCCINALPAYFLHTCSLYAWSLNACSLRSCTLHAWSLHACSLKLFPIHTFALFMVMSLHTSPQICHPLTFVPVLFVWSHTCRSCILQCIFTKN